MTPFVRLSAAGFAATAITYGPARMGFGLFLPQLKSAFAISTHVAGVVSSLGFLGFFAGLLASQVMTNRIGPRLPVAAGLAAATAGIAVAAAAPNWQTLCVGVVLAMSSAGFSWTPFNNAVHRSVEDGWRPGALSSVSSGTGFGIAVAGIAALVMSMSGLSWRQCWVVFALGSVLALLLNWRSLRDVAGTPGPDPVQRWSVLLQPSAAPIFALALCYGITSAIYISFAADGVAQAGGLPDLQAGASGGLIFLCYGLFGLSGLYSGRLKAAIGLPWLLRLLMLASALSFGLLALVPTVWPGVVLSAGLQGVNVMMMSAVLAFWSDRLFPTLPSQSFTAVLLAVAAGCVLGPVAAGFVSSTVGMTPMFLGTAGLATAAAAAVRARFISEQPAAADGITG